MIKHPLLLLACAALPATAQIRTDASLGLAAQTLQGPNYLIGQQLGRLSGQNLFHSFQTFNLATGESATFTLTSSGIANVVSRVTGGSASSINGALKLQAAGGTPAFYFINPAGMVFGNGASVDVPGALHVSTADSLRFADGSRLYADLAKASSFSAAAPEAFGFLGTNRGVLGVTDGAVIAGKAQQPISLSAGDVAIDNATVAASGGIRLAAVGAQPIDLNLSGDLPALAGRLQLTGGALVGSSTVGPADAGPVSLSAGSIWLDSEASISSFGRAGTSGQGAALLLQATGTVSLSNGANLYTSARGSGDAGAISVQANRLLLDSGGYLYADTRAGSSGRGGALLVKAQQDLTLGGGASISADVNGSGAGGLINLNAGSVKLTGGAYVSNAALSGSGNANEVVVNATQGVSLDGGAQLLSFTLTSGTTGALRVTAGAGLSLAGAASIGNVANGSGANAGDVVIKLGGDLSLTGASTISTNGLAGGNAGSVSVSGRHLAFSGASHISGGSVDGLGSAGSVQLNAAGTVSLEGDSYVAVNSHTDRDGGSLQVRAQNLTLGGGSYLTSSALDGLGNAGSIDVAATGRIELTSGAFIGSATASAGRGGSVRLAAPEIKLSDQALVFTNSSGATGGDAGQVEINAPGSFSLSSGASVDSSTFSLLGKGGSISITAGSLALDQGSLSSRSGGSDLHLGSGQAGTIQLQVAGTASLSNNSLISTSTFSRGNAGLIQMGATNLVLDHATLVSLAQPGSRGAAGSISVKLSGDFKANAGGIGAAANAGSAGQVGSIDVQAAGQLTLSNGAALTTSNDATVAAAGSLKPTTLNVRAGQLSMTGNSAISASATGNVAASNVQVQASDAATLVNSRIDTSANEGNGGAVALDAGHVLVLDNSQVTTSVVGAQGNGGNIAVTADVALLKTGFVQANTVAKLASGGLVNVKVKSLVASGNSLFVGGAQPLPFKPGVFGFNVIQAAAPDGVNGVIAITSPVLDLSGSLSVLDARPIDTGGLGRSPCRTPDGSSLALGGRGGLPASARSWLGAWAAEIRTRAGASFGANLDAGEALDGPQQRAGNDEWPQKSPWPEGLTPKRGRFGVAPLARAPSPSGAARLASPPFWGQRGYGFLPPTLLGSDALTDNAPRPGPTLALAPAGACR